MFVKWSLLYIQFINCFFICLNLYVDSFLLNCCRLYVGCFYKKYFFYGCKMVIISYPVHWLIRYFRWSFCSFFSFKLLLSVCLRPFSKLRFFFVWMWIIHYCKPRFLIDYLLTKICLFFLFPWIIVAGLAVVVFTTTDFSCMF